LHAAPRGAIEAADELFALVVADALPTITIEREA
jgi:hypothetical protein